MANPEKSASITADGQDRPLLSTQQAFVADLTDSTTGTAGATLADGTGTYSQTIFNDNFASLNAQVNKLADVLESHGLMADA